MIRRGRLLVEHTPVDAIIPRAELLKRTESMEIPEIRSKLSGQGNLLEQFKVKSLSIFGSVARGEARADSDIDILVEFSGPIGLLEFVRLKRILGTLLGSRIDLVTVGALKKQLREKILAEAIRAA